MLTKEQLLDEFSKLTDKEKKWFICNANQVIFPFNGLDLGEPKFVAHQDSHKVIIEPFQDEHESISPSNSPAVKPTGDICQSQSHQNCAVSGKELLLPDDEDKISPGQTKEDQIINQFRDTPPESIESETSIAAPDHSECEFLPLPLITQIKSEPVEYETQPVETKETSSLLTPDEDTQHELPLLLPKVEPFDGSYYSKTFGSQSPTVYRNNSNTDCEMKSDEEAQDDLYPMRPCTRLFKRRLIEEEEEEEAIKINEKQTDQTTDDDDDQYSDYEQETDQSSDDDGEDDETEEQFSDTDEDEEDNEDIVKFSDDDGDDNDELETATNSDDSSSQSDAELESSCKKPLKKLKQTRIQLQPVIQPVLLQIQPSQMCAKKIGSLVPKVHVLRLPGFMIASKERASSLDQIYSSMTESILKKRIKFHHRSKLNHLVNINGKVTCRDNTPSHVKKQQANIRPLQCNQNESRVLRSTRLFSSSGDK